jgi:ankyrin repeat protein
MSRALEALYEGDVERAKQLLPADADLTVFEAAAFGRIERLREILATDRSQANALSPDGFSALHLAIFGGQEQAARVLIANGADVDRCSGGSIARVPPLGTAAFVGSVHMARLLLDAGADVNARGEGGFTALHTAAQNGDVELAAELLARNADRNATTQDGVRPGDLATTDDMRRLLG